MATLSVALVITGNRFVCQKAKATLPDVNPEVVLSAGLD